MTVFDGTRAILAELAASLAALDGGETEALLSEILAAERVFVAGAGRSLLMIRSFAMRLMQLGLTAYVVGETVTPAIRPGDLLIIGSGSGETGALRLMAEKAKAVGARLALITIRPDSAIGGLSDRTVRIHAPSSKLAAGKGPGSVQPGASLFEQSLLLLCDVLVLELTKRLGLSDENALLMQNHANLE